MATSQASPKPVTRNYATRNVQVNGQAHAVYFQKDTKGFSYFVQVSGRPSTRIDIEFDPKTSKWVASFLTTRLSPNFLGLKKVPRRVSAPTAQDAFVKAVQRFWSEV